jgi:hypothetical protein
LQDAVDSGSYGPVTARMPGDTFRSTFVARALVAVVAASSGCFTAPEGGSGPGANGADSGADGTMAPPPGRIQVTVTSDPAPFPVAWTLTDAAGEVVATGVGVAGTPIVVSGVMPGSGYAIVVSGAADANTTCGGGFAPFAVAPSATVMVAVTLSCTPVCGLWQSVTPHPTGTVGDAIVLAATGNGPIKPALRFVWTVLDPTVGHLGPTGQGDAGPTSSTTPFFCDAPGATELSLTVFDAPDASCPPILETVSVVAVCLAPDAGAAGDGG